MFRRMLIGIDHSESSRHALDQALTLAGSEESEVVLVSVVPAYQGDLRLMGDSSILETIKQPYEQALAHAAGRAAELGIRHRTRLLSGEPGEQLLNAVDEERADLVVIGKKVSRLMDLIPIGSVSAKLLKLCEIDVLILPQGRQLDLGSIMVAYDGSKHAELAAEKACGLALRYGSECHLATIYEMSLEGYALSPGIASRLHEEASKRQEPVLNLFQEKGVRRYHSVIEHGDPVYRALSELAKRKGVGLALIGSRGIGNLSKILLGSVAARFISSGACPTLVVKQ